MLLHHTIDPVTIHYRVGYVPPDMKFEIQVKWPKCM